MYTLFLLILGIPLDVEFCWYIQRNYELIQDEIDIGIRSGVADASFITEVYNLIQNLSQETREICVLNNITQTI